MRRAIDPGKSMRWVRFKCRVRRWVRWGWTEPFKRQTQQRKAIWKAARVVCPRSGRADSPVASPEVLVIDPSGVLSWDKQQLGRLVTGADIFIEVRLGDLL